MKHSFCDDWEFTHHWTEAFGKGLPVPKQQAVRLPHTCREVPLHYATPADYEMVCGYRKRFRVPPVQAAPRLVWGKRTACCFGTGSPLPKASVQW